MNAPVENFHTVRRTGLGGSGIARPHGRARIETVNTGWKG